MLTYEYLHNNFYYSDGKLYSEETREPVGYVDERGKTKYLRVLIEGKHYYVHRLIFWRCKGYLPKLVDHEDKNGLNNDINNLRDLSHSLNLINKTERTDNTSGVTGVRWNKNAGKWIARVQYKNKEYHLGCFSSKDDAIKARQVKVEQLFQEV